MNHWLFTAVVLAVMPLLIVLLAGCALRVDSQCREDNNACFQRVFITHEWRLP